MFSNALILFILFSKKQGSVFDYENLKDLLGEMYSYHMKREDVLYILLEALNEALGFNDFQIPFRGDNVRILHNLLMSPLKNEYNFTISGNNIHISSEDMFNRYFVNILNTFMLTNIGWCKEELGLQEGNIIISDELLQKARKSLIRKNIK